MPQPIWAGDDIELNNLHPESPRISESNHTPHRHDPDFNEISLADEGSTDKVVAEPTRRKCWAAPILMAPTLIAVFLVIGAYIAIIIPSLTRHPSPEDTVGEGEPAWPEHANFDDSTCLFGVILASVVHYVIFVCLYRCQRDGFCLMWIVVLAVCLTPALLYLCGIESILTVLGIFSADFQSKVGAWACRLHGTVGSGTWQYGTMCAATVSCPDIKVRGVWTEC